MALLRNAHYAAGLVALQLVFIIVIASVTGTKLKQSNGDCYLNLLPGAVCDFVFVTSGMCGLFAVLVGVGTFITLRQANTAGAFLPAIFGSLSFFTAFWWMVAAITFTKRAAQAEDDGLPEGSARTAVVALSWIESVLAFFAFLLVIHDRVKFRSWRLAQEKSRSLLDLEDRAAFKTEYASTQVGSTPIV
ncbi:hypothetical protein ACK3TF_000804 [Chlorella vulgaris]